MSTTGDSPRRHRADGVTARRWLQRGAACVGMGVALIGWSLVGSEIGVASADNGASSSSAGSTASSARGAAGAAAPSSGRAGTAKSRSGTGARSQPPRKVTSGPNRAEATEIPLAATTLTGPPGVTSLVVAAATPNGKVAAAASRSDPLGALGKFLTGTLKELLNRKTTLNPLQRLDDLSPKQKSLLDLIPRIPVRKEDSLGYREIQAREAERQQRADANNARIADIIRTGIKLTASDGSPVYSVDGKVFVQYRVMSWINGAPGPRQPVLFTLSDRSSQRNRDGQIRAWLKLDPALVKSTWKK